MGALLPHWSPTRQAVPLPALRAWAIDAASIPDWLFGECYDAVGDFAETVTLLLPEPDEWTADVDRSVLPFEGPQPLHRWVEDVLLPLRDQDEMAQRAIVRAVWATLGGTERFVWNKLITGAFRGWRLAAVGCAGAGARQPRRSRCHRTPPDG
jgi:DNA ligase-1